MPSRHDLMQDQHLADLDAEVADLRKRITSNLRLINKVAKDVNARLAALEPSGQNHQPAPSTSSRRNKTAKGATIR